MQKLKPVIVLGAGEHGNVVKNIFKHGRRDIFFLDDLIKSTFVLGKLSSYKLFSGNKYDFFVGIGNNLLRKKWIVKLIQNGKNLVNAIHPNCYIEKEVKIGRNVMVGANSYININTLIGDGVIINNSCVIEHDNLIDKYTHIAPGVITGGGVKIKEGSFIGMGSVVVDHITIEKNNFIGAGSVVTKNTIANSFYVGIPAKRKKYAKK